MISGVDVYNLSWKPPGRSFDLGMFHPSIIITGCDFDAYRLDDLTNSTVLWCNVTCPNEGITEKIARQMCNGIGCCRRDTLLQDDRAFMYSVNLKFVRHGRRLKSEAERKKPNQSSLRDRIGIEASFLSISWAVTDEPNCAAAKNKVNYACVSEHSICSHPDNFLSNPSYNCACEDGYFGNAYIPGGCFRDRGNIILYFLTSNYMACLTFFLVNNGYKQ